MLEGTSRRLLNTETSLLNGVSSHLSHPQLRQQVSRSQDLAEICERCLLKAKPPQHQGDGERNHRPVVLVGAQAVQVALADLGNHQVGVGVNRSRLAALPIAVAAGTVIIADTQRAAEAVEDVGQRGHELGGDLDGATAARERIDGCGEVTLDLVVDGLRDACEGWVQRRDELRDRGSVCLQVAMVWTSGPREGVTYGSSQLLRTLLLDRDTVPDQAPHVQDLETGLIEVGLLCGEVVQQGGDIGLDAQELDADLCSTKYKTVSLTRPVTPSLVIIP